MPSDEKKKRNKVNGFLSVDVCSGEESLILSPQAKTEDVVSYMALLCDEMIQKGGKKSSIFLDKNSTHKPSYEASIK